MSEGHLSGPRRGRGVVEGELKTDLSPENLDQLDADVLIFAEDDEGEIRPEVTKDPRYQDLPAVRNDAVFFVNSTQSLSLEWLPYSVDWMLDYWVPQLKKTDYYTGE